MEKVKLNTIEEAIEDFKAGNFVIVVDDEDRENEGDLIIAAEKITPEKVNYKTELSNRKNREACEESLWPTFEKQGR